MGRQIFFYGPLAVWVVATAVFLLVVVVVVERRGRFSLALALIALTLCATILGIFVAGAKYADWLST
jgi:hypothetical protein